MQISTIFRYIKIGYKGYLYNKKNNFNKWMEKWAEIKKGESRASWKARSFNLKIKGVNVLQVIYEHSPALDQAKIEAIMATKDIIQRATWNVC